MTEQRSDERVCSYCKKPADGTLHDEYGEWMMNRSDLVVCAECDEEMAAEPGPWSGWGD